jgi:integrase
LTAIRSWQPSTNGLGDQLTDDDHEDVSRLLGHSTIRVTQDLYIAPDADLYDRLYRATA